MTRFATTARFMIPGALACAMLACPVTAYAADGKSQPKHSDTSVERSNESMMAEMEKYAKPGAPHELLKQFAGTWKTVSKVWTGPGEPQVFHGMSDKTVILGGRFLKEEYNGIFMGEPFSGTGTTGYDMVKKEYIGNWVDTMGTGQMIMKGAVDASGKVITWKGTGLDPMTMKDQEYTMISRLIDKNTHSFSFMQQVDGKDVVMMEITYSRK